MKIRLNPKKIVKGLIVFVALSFVLLASMYFTNPDGNKFYKFLLTQNFSSPTIAWVTTSTDEGENFYISSTHWAIQTTHFSNPNQTKIFHIQYLGLFGTFFKGDVREFRKDEYKQEEEAPATNNEIKK